MFNGLRNEIVKLNADVKNVTNCEKAKKLRKNLLLIGIPLAVIGFGGALICLIIFISGMIGNFTSMADSMVDSYKNPDGTMGSRMNISALIPNFTPMFLMIPFFVMGAIGATLIGLALKIIITGYTTDLIDGAVNDKCPKCGDKIDEGEMYCSNCGHAFNRECYGCGNINDPKNKFCSKCGRQLK